MGNYKYCWFVNYKPIHVLVFIWPIMLMSCSRQPQDFSNNKAYEFPIKPGTKEWQALADHDKMVRVCQVPAGILHSMSTVALVETVLNYPMFWTTIISNNTGTRQGFNVLVSQFNGVSELLSRRDAGGALLLKYRAVCPPKKGATDIEIGNYIFYCYSIEILFAQRAIHLSLTETQVTELKKELLAKYEIKKELKENKGLGKEIMSLLALEYNLTDKVQD